MTQFKVGDRVRVVNPWAPGLPRGSEHTVIQVSHEFVYVGGDADGWFPHRFELVASAPEVEEPDMVNHPPHYKFSNGAEVIEISENLTSNAGQAVQYLARSSRIDGKNKGDTLEDLRKARWLIDREIARVEAH